MTKLRRTISFLLIASLMLLVCSCSKPGDNIGPTDDAGMATETEQPIQPTAVAGNVPFVRGSYHACGGGSGSALHESAVPGTADAQPHSFCVARRDGH